VTLSFLTLQFIPILLTTLPKPKIFLLSSMESFNVVSTAATVRAMMSLKESLVKVTSYTLITSSDSEKVLDMTKDVTRGASTPSAKMGGRLTNINDRLSMSFSRPAPP
jgi:hypothetical protein